VQVQPVDIWLGSFAFEGLAGKAASQFFGIDGDIVKRMGWRKTNVRSPCVLVFFLVKSLSERPSLV
jgi:hypothetical protein